MTLDPNNPGPEGYYWVRFTDDPDARPEVAHYLPKSRPDLDGSSWSFCGMESMNDWPTEVLAGPLEPPAISK